MHRTRTDVCANMRALTLIVAAGCLGNTFGGEEQRPATSDRTTECIGCHESINPGLVADWRTSRHAGTTPRRALELEQSARRISSDSIPEGLAEVSVGCYECHGQGGKDRKGAFEHFGSTIHTVVSPADCQTCHAEEERQYRDSKKAHALDNLRKNPVFDQLVQTALAAPESSSASTKGQACYACHGTEVSVVGTTTVATDLGDIQIPALSNWPNQGVGRINPDGTRGACTACHPRHSFSIEVARKPHTCGQCHLDPDVPAYNIYTESKHGNIMKSQADEWNWSAVPWKAGEHFTAPSCATCHNALVVSPGGETIVERTHDFGARLWVRIFGLPYSHAQPKSGATYRIVNADSMPLPTTFSGESADSFLIDSTEQARRRATMGALCGACHASTWTAGHFAALDTAVAETDRMVRASTALIRKAWEKKCAAPGNPFDEPAEHLWTRQWLFYANSIRYAAAMGGPDYASFKNGWWQMRENHAKLKDYCGKGGRKRR